MFGRLERFLSTTFPLSVYGSYAVLWVLGLAGALAVASDSGAHWRLSVRTLVGVMSVLLVLLFLRMADEQKDLDYDRAHHPRRPLVTGAVSVRDLRLWMAQIATLVLLMNAAMGASRAVTIGVDMAYGVFLMALERWSSKVRDGLFLNLLVTYPVQLGLSIYIYVSFVSDHDEPSGMRGALLVGMLMLAFLHFELARKTSWSQPSDERLYSSVVGPTRSALLASGCAGAAPALALSVFQPWDCGGVACLTGWTPLASVIPAGVGAYRFLTRRDRTWARAWAMLFVFLFYAALTLHGLCGSMLDISLF